jgi:hypothetical protein
MVKYFMDASLSAYQKRCLGEDQCLVRFAAEQQSGRSAASVRRDHDEVALLLARRIVSMK